MSINMAVDSARPAAQASAFAEWYRVHSIADYSIPELPPVTMDGFGRILSTRRFRKSSNPRLKLWKTAARSQ